MLNSKHDYTDILSYKIGTFIEAYKLLELLEKKNFCLSKNDILNIIQYDNSLNKRAVDKLLERTNERFRIIFGFDKTEYYYDRRVKKYLLTIENTTKLLPYKLLYDYLQTLLLAKQIDNDKTILSKAIRFNNEYNAHNISLLIKVIHAIINKNTIEFEHFNHFSGKKATHLVEPWFIKQYNNRFFLGCYRLQKNNTNDSGFKTFTINQIEANSLKILDKKINSLKKEEDLIDIQYQIFESCIGMRIHSEKNPNGLYIKADIVIETNYKIGKDWLNLPIHKNQQFIATKDNGNHIFRFPNFFFNDEFKKIILGLGSSVKVLEPHSVIIELKEEITKTSSLY